MPFAFVLICSETGYEDEVVKALKKLKKVVEAYSVYGVYDVLAKVESDTMDKLKDIIHTKIRGLDHIESTLTMIGIKEGR